MAIRTPIEEAKEATPRIFGATKYPKRYFYALPVLARRFVVRAKYETVLARFRVSRVWRL